MLWFNWNGVDSRDMEVRLNKYPVKTRGRWRLEKFKIPRRAGIVIRSEGQNIYDSVTISIDITILNNEKYDAVRAWLSGEGVLVIFDDDERCYKGFIEKEVEYSNWRHGRGIVTATVDIDCEPFRYAYPQGDKIEIIDNGATVDNPGTVESLPIYRVYGEGKVSILIGTQKAIQIDMGDMKQIVLYADTQDAISEDGTQLVNNKVNGRIPYMELGMNGISWTGKVSKIEIEPRWCWK